LKNLTKIEIKNITNIDQFFAATFLFFTTVSYTTKLAFLPQTVEKNWHKKSLILFCTSILLFFSFFKNCKKA